MSTGIQGLKPITDRKRIPLKDPWFSPDKMDHLLFSATLASGGFLALKVTGHEENDALMISSASVMVIGLFKEIFDFYRPQGHASWRDLTVDLIGITLGVVIASSL